MNEKAERILSATAGMAAVAFGFRRHGAGRVVPILTGAAAIAYGAVGRSRIQEAIDGSSIANGPISRVITVGKPKEEIYSKWLDPNVMSAIFGDALEISQEGQDRMRVRFSVAGRVIEWTLQLVQQEEGSRLCWRTEPDAAVPHELFVELRAAEPSTWGTEVTLGFAPLAGQTLPKTLFGTTEFATKAILYKILGRFKALIETGEVPTLSKNPAGQPRTLAVA